MTSPPTTPRPLPTVRLAGGRVVLVHDGHRVAVAAADADGALVDVTLFGTVVQAWAARVATVLRAHPPAADVTPAELRSPWVRDGDGEPALAIERLTRGPQVRWRVLVRAGAREAQVELGEAEVGELLHRLSVPPESAREVG